MSALLIHFLWTRRIISWTLLHLINFKYFVVKFGNWRMFLRKTKKQCGHSNNQILEISDFFVLNN